MRMLPLSSSFHLSDNSYWVYIHIKSGRQAQALQQAAQAAGHGHTQCPAVHLSNDVTALRTLRRRARMEQLLCSHSEAAGARRV